VLIEKNNPFSPMFLKNRYREKKYDSLKKLDVCWFIDRGCDGFQRLRTGRSSSARKHQPLKKRALNRLPEKTIIGCLSRISATEVGKMRSLMPFAG
jgi:hypothetical protein